MGDDEGDLDAEAQLCEKGSSMTMAAPASYTGSTADKPLLGDTIGANLSATVARWPDRPAVVDVAAGKSYTYAEFGDLTDSLALSLLADGVKVGDRVGIWAPNCVEWMITQYATAKIGAILVTINPAYRTHELDFVLRQAGISVLISAREFKTSNYASMITKVRDQCTALRRIVYIGGDFDELIEAGAYLDRDRLAAIEIGPDQPINIQYTSGTTGFPKGATLSHHNILNNGFFVGEGCRYTEQDVICAPVPLYHCFGMVMGNLASTTHGCCIVYPSPGFDPAATLQAVQDYRCTSLYGVPTMFIAELAMPDVAEYDLTSLRTGIMAGSPCPVEVMKKVISEFGMAEVTICYRMTETSPVSTQTDVHDGVEERTSTVGRTHPHLESKVIDPVTGLAVPRGVPGELCTRGYSVMLGYWDQPGKTAEVIDAARWMHTGDLAVMNGAGYINITGRIKDLVIRGGENVYPREVEEFLYAHPDIIDAQVIGVPDERYGEELMAWVRMREGATPLTAQDIREFCEGRLAHFKIPRYVHLVEDFPMTVTGKVRKVQMREEAVVLLGLESAASITTA
jgi:fatty-acyl-CoA synthase